MTREVVTGQLVWKDNVIQDNSQKEGGGREEGDGIEVQKVWGKFEEGGTIEAAWHSAQSVGS